MPHFDYIIVGRGLAGSVLALSLMKKNKTVLVIDNPKLSSSSKVAAGLFQPMTFKRTIETWKGLESIQKATKFYQWAEEVLGESFFHLMPMARLFSSYEEQNNWTLKISDSSFSKLIGEETNEDAEKCKNEFGYGSVNFAGYLDVPLFLNATENILRNKNALEILTIDYDSITISPNEIRIGQNSADKIIFCEGWLIKDNPWFNYIPMKPVKGEVITVKIPERNNKSILSSGLFCIPRIEGDYKIGSNYEWKVLDEVPSTEIKNEFVTEIRQILGVNEIIVEKHEAGIRPAANDRRPIIGQHPIQNSFYVLNGLGARGVALAPYTVDLFCNHLIDLMEIPNEINVDRFLKHFRS